MVSPEVGSVALALQFAVRGDPCRSARSGAIDADQFALVVVDTDDPELPIDGLGVDLGREPRRDTLAPGLLRDAIDGVGSSTGVSADEAVDCRCGAVADQIAAHAGNVGSEIGREQA